MVRPGLWSRLLDNDNFIGYLFIAPLLLGLIVFTYGPVVAALGLSFTRGDYISTPTWIGLGNYSALAADDLFWKSMYNTIYYVIGVVPAGLVLSLLLAIAMNQKLRGIVFFRTIFFLPTITSSVAISLMWLWIYNPEFGVLNFLLRQFDIRGPAWLSSTTWAMPAVIIMAVWRGRTAGSFGRAGAYSFYPTKNMHALEGGMVTTADAGTARTLRLLRNQGMEQRYANEIVGANMRMTDVSAAIGRVQLGRLAEWTERRRAHAARLDAALTAVTPPPQAPGARHVYHQYTVRVPGDRDAAQQALTDRGVGSAVYYPTPIHRLAPYWEPDQKRGRHWELPETERAAREVLSLPVHPALSEGDLERIADAVNAIGDAR
jgi:hypothetical protein